MPCPQGTEEGLERETPGRETRPEVIPPAQEQVHTGQGWGGGVKIEKGVWG